MGNSYLKLKVTEHIACFYYKHNNIYIQRTISGHPDNYFNSPKSKTYDEYYNYGGDYYVFDGNYNTLHEILNDFNPETNSIGYLIERLEAECDLQRYVGLWAKIKEWGNNILSYIKPTLNLTFAWPWNKKEERHPRMITA
jgi:hypothetical protein